MQFISAEMAISFCIYHKFYYICIAEAQYLTMTVEVPHQNGVEKTTWRYANLINLYIYMQASDKSILITERNKAIWAEYCNAMADRNVKNHREAIERAANAQACRYWITVAEAKRQIARIMNDKMPTYGINGHKWRMIWDLYSKVCSLKEHGGMKNKPIEYIIIRAVLSDAPSNYISYRRARYIIENTKKRKI